MNKAKIRELSLQSSRIAKTITVAYENNIKIDYETLLPLCVKAYSVGKYKGLSYIKNHLRRTLKWLDEPSKKPIR